MATSLTPEQIAARLTKPQARALVAHVAHRDAHPTWTMLLGGFRTSAGLRLAGCLMSEDGCYEVTPTGRAVAAILKAS